MPIFLFFHHIQFLPDREREHISALAVNLSNQMDYNTSLLEQVMHTLSTIWWGFSPVCCLWSGRSVDNQHDVLLLHTFLKNVKLIRFLHRLLSIICLPIFTGHPKVEVLESGKVDSDEKFHFLESDIVQLRTALRISSEQTLLLEKKLASAAERNAEYCRENRQLKEGKYATVQCTTLLCVTLSHVVV